MSDALTIDDPRVPAMVDMLGRTGALDVEIRYSDPAEDGDEGPVIWMAIGQWKRGGRTVYETDASMNPARAVARLCERVMDGGKCRHCKRTTAFDPGFEDAFLEETLCWYQWDPERKRYRRGCE